MSELLMGNFIYSKKFTRWDKGSIITYLVISILVLYYYWDRGKLEENSQLIIFYSISTQLYLYLFNYRSLRNFKVYLIWFIIGLLHLFFYFQLKDLDSVQMINGNASQGLRNTVLMLVLFQALRFVSLKIQNLELVPADRSGFNDLDERIISMVDYILFVIYFGMTAFLAMY